jgi:heptaprenyl diphosphate synthase
VAPASPLLALPSAPADLARVEAALLAAVHTSDDSLTDIASHLIIAGGKRLRPMLAVAAAMTAGSPASDEVVQGGVSVELVQTGSLYHDDVIDEADVRRSAPSVNARWGNLRAILAGDFLLARASEIAASLGVEVAGLLARTISDLCLGQMSELRTAFDRTRTEAAYLASITGKTASLFSAASRIGAIVGGLERSAIEALTRYGLAYGMVFQLVDDVLDLTATEAELGKPAGHDLVEGVYTLPVIATLAAGGTPAGELADLLGKPLDAAELDKALSIVRSGSGVAAAIARARGFADDAVAALAPVPGSTGGEAVEALAAAPHALIDGVAPGI